MREIKGILFDYVNTLVNNASTGPYRRAFADAVRRIFAIEFGPRWRELEDAPFRDATWSAAYAYEDSFKDGNLAELDIWQWYDEAFAKHGLVMRREILDQLVHIDHAVYPRIVRPLPHVREVLEELRRCGYRLGVVSNYVFRQRWIDYFPFLSRYEGLIDTITLSSEVGLRKPHPQIYEAALAAIELAPSEVVFVGDRLREDVRGPKRFGMRAAVLTREYRREEDPSAEADAVIEHLSELPALLASGELGEGPRVHV